MTRRRHRLAVEPPRVDAFVESSGRNRYPYADLPYQEMVGFADPDHPPPGLERECQKYGVSACWSEMLTRLWVSGKDRQ